MKLLNLPTIQFTFWHILAFLIIICYHNIYIFTEESILLFCFIAWVNITWNYVAPQINESLADRARRIQSNLQQVSQDNTTTWKNYRQGYSFKMLHASLLNKLTPYLTHLIKDVLLLESKSKAFQSIIPYLKRLNMVKELEARLTKVSYTTVCQRIQDTTAVREFYANQLKIKFFHSEVKLDVLERIKKLGEYA
uniref:Ymf39 n=1 Tax=Bangia fuscopurpurea TaxID=101920 RepID=A0A0E3GPI2_BANFU|nr:hypothetical protein [Bangia fuscopurpurea]AKA66495.1 hypothetical protein [Bangia fuscopurpurea]